MSPITATTSKSSNAILSSVSKENAETMARQGGF